MPPMKAAPDIVLRPARATEDQRIREIIRAEGLNPMGIHWENFIVAEAGTTIVGIGQVKQHGDGSRELASLAVLPDWRRQGIAGRIIEELSGREKGVLYLMCRDALGPFYARFGFREIQPSEMPAYFRRIRAFLTGVQRLRHNGVRVLIMQRG